MAAVLGRDAGGRLVRRAGIMAVVVAGGDVRAGDATGVALPAGPHRTLGWCSAGSRSACSWLRRRHGRVEVDQTGAMLISCCSRFSPSRPQRTDDIVPWCLGGEHGLLVPPVPFHSAFRSTLSKNDTRVGFQRWRSSVGWSAAEAFPLQSCRRRHAVGSQDVSVATM
jgi:hypothetical protein